METTLPSGLRLVHELTDSPVIYTGLVVCSGTRHEDPADSGMAHFIEHTTFKGTARRKAYQVSGLLERVGGDLNAYTSKQETVYYATVPSAADFARAADLLLDITLHSQYPTREIEKEADVICDEIESYQDSPAELIFDEFEAMLFPSHPLGRDILGRAERLRQYTTADALRFAQGHYRPENMVMFVYGNISFARALHTVERLLRDEPPATPLTAYPATLSDRTPDALPSDKSACLWPVPLAPATERVVEKQTHQAHVLMGGRAFAGDDERRYALMLLQNVLGGPGMSSRLGQSLRERRGLVYSVDAYTTIYPDAAWWSVYFGCDQEDVARCRRLVCDELRRVSEQALTPAALRAAKKQLCGQISIARDNRESYALALGKTFAHYGRHRDVEALCRRLQALTADDLLQAAHTAYQPDRMSVLCYV